MQDIENAPETDIRPSRSQLKRDAQALQDLAEALIGLPRDRLARLTMPESLREAVDATAAITQHGARRRQLRYLAGLLRRVEDVEPFRQAVAGCRADSAEAARQLHRIEHWRDRLLEEGDHALSALLAEYPVANSQALRQLLRNAQKEREQGMPPKSARLLFKALKALLDTAKS